MDPVIFAVVQKMEFKLLEPECEPAGYFPKLCREIIAQQLGGKAAHTILERFYTLFPRKRITPEKVLALSEAKLRAVGMSWAKACYVRNLAEHAAAKKIQFNIFPTTDDEMVIAELTKMKGIGRWTAEMFLMFTLGREDVFSYGDLGLQRGFEMLYGKRKAASRTSMDGVIQKWSPYRSYGSLALWHIKDNGC